MLAYRIDLTPDDNGTLLVTCPDLPEVTSFGDDEADALKRALDAVEEALAGRIANKQAIPRPSGKAGLAVALPALIAAKVQLYLLTREEKVTRAELSRRLGWKREQVDRLFRLNHASRLDQLEAAFRVFNKRIDLQVRDAA
ncbi:MAG: type II toxin-antitoxin system HicB family antitoxin [Bauldia sp.]